MAVIQRAVTLAAGEQNDNVLAGSAFEFARTNSLMQAGVNASGVGAFVTIQSGSDIVLEESEAVNIGAFPKIPDEMYYTDVAAQGDRLVVKIRNPTAGSIIFRVIVQLTQLR